MMAKSQNRFLALLLAFVILNISNHQVNSIQSIDIAGTSYMSDLFDSWTSEYVLQEPSIQFNYTIYSSDDALQQLINDAVPIAALDFPLDDSTRSQYPDIQTVPIVGGSVVPYYSLLSVGLTLDRETLARIFLGNITTWNDDAIQATNPSVGLSAATINVVYRIDDSFSTLALSQALSSISTEWREKYGISNSFPRELKSLPNFYGATGETGVFTLARILGNGMTYLTANSMLHTLNLVQYARLLNQNGTRTDLRLQYTAPVLEASVNLFNDQMVANIADLDLPMAFPIVAYSYLAYKKSSSPSSMCSDLAQAIQFLAYSINFSIPITTANIYGYSYLPNTVASLVRDRLFNITCNGNILVSSTDTAPAPFVYYDYVQQLDTFSGLTIVPYVPFYNYLGSTISKSQAPVLVLSTISSLYNNGNHSSSSSSLKPSPLLFSITLFICLIFSMNTKVIKRLNSITVFLTLAFLMYNCCLVESQTTTVRLGYLYPFTGPSADIGTQMEAAARVSISNVNAVDNQTYLFSYVTTDCGDTLSSGDFAVVNAVTRFFSNIVIGGLDSDVTEAMTALSDAYITPFVAAGARGNSLTTGTYQYFSRVVPADRSDGYALAAIIEFYGWSNTVALISSSDDYGVGTSKALISQMNEYGYSPLIEERYFSGATDFSDQMDNIRRSLARVIVILTGTANDTAGILLDAERYHLIGDQFVWFAGSPSCTSSFFVDSSTGAVNSNIKDLANGLICLKLKGGYGPAYESFLDQWEQLDPVKYPGAGKRSIAVEATYSYDAVSLVTYALLQNFTTLDGLLYYIRNANITGLTGELNLNGTQDRLGIFNIVNLQDNTDGDNGFVIVGDYYETEKFDPISLGVHFQYNIQFHSGSITIPDLIIHNSLTYWSCTDKKEKTDKSGKEIRLDPPGPHAKYLDKKYRCDQFIDCYNMSDENGCTPSYPAAYIAIGIILGLSILFGIVCIIFTITFGYVFKRKRIRTASPLFLILICISCIVGFGSDYAYFGQDSKVSCIFRMWLVTLAIITMISSLFIKSFRVWRLYRAKSKIVPLPDWKLIILIILMIIPVIVIDVLWSAIATPTASLIEINNEKHYVCHAGGVAGDPYGYVFFGIVCGYIGLILLFGVFLSIVTRNIISTFNESRLIAVSTYNLFFLGIIGIPVYLVIYQSNPLASWVIYEVCVLYGFISTLAMQFVPKMYGIVVVDKFKNTSLNLDYVSKGETTASAQGFSDPNALF